MTLIILLLVIGILTLFGFPIETLNDTACILLVLCIIGDIIMTRGWRND